MQKFCHASRWRRVVGVIAVLLGLGLGIQAAGPGGAAPASAQTLLQVSAGGPYSGTAGFSLSVSASVSGALNPQFTWSFGDGTFGSGQFTSHVYNAAGVFAVTVSVMDLATGQTASASTTASISGSTTCIPGVTVPFGTACSNVVSCGFGVSVLFGSVCPTLTTCGFGVTAFFGTGCSVGLSCSTGVATLLPSACATGVSCVAGLSVVCPGGIASTAPGCTSGIAPCLVGQTCTPISGNQVFCTTAGQTTPAPSTTATTATAAPTTVTSTAPPTVDSCAPYDSSCAYCANHPTASICKPQQ